jgi:hypothetical protein
LNLTIQRVTQTKRSTTGRLSIDGNPEFVTLEPPKLPNPPPDGNGFVCILAGTYRLTIRWSNRFARPVPHVEAVPGRSEIEMHFGNWARNTDGCTLIGKDFDDQPDYISQSDASFNALMVKLYAGATCVNPGADQQHQLWEVGSVQYIDPQGVSQ